MEEEEMQEKEEETSGKKTNCNIQKEIDYNSRSISFDRSKSSEVWSLLRLASMSVVGDQDERSLDEKRLGRAVRDTGEYTNGIAAVEVWMFDEETGKLEPFTSTGA
uniref:Uncharacterized protein n=1 Tax=Ditylum brightwellii TaxID=49249 RepID=A0A6V2E505_9STRA|mmetsp:Transcript_51690/g.77303  ORF Transcript_51690/g.77303 Transcript_51690/m.77303 type:complete len:106 (+) Transcript_51690:282-599(+)